MHVQRSSGGSVVSAAKRKYGKFIPGRHEPSQLWCTGAAAEAVTAAARSDSLNEIKSPAIGNDFKY